jgi:hypothetical protein
MARFKPRRSEDELGMAAAADRVIFMPLQSGHEQAEPPQDIGLVPSLAVIDLRRELLDEGRRSAQPFRAGPVVGPF